MTAQSTEDRFWSKVIGGDYTNCWLWSGTTNRPNGYGTFAISRADGYPRSRTIGAHRWAYQHMVGEIPAGLELDHLCRHPQCVNPYHLEPVTHSENMRRGAVARQFDPKPTKPRALVHGISGYARLCRCDICSDAMAAASKSGKAQREARGCPDDKHGTTNGYYNYGCRCTDCRSAAREMDRNRRNRSAVSA